MKLMNVLILGYLNHTQQNGKEFRIIGGKRELSESILQEEKHHTSIRNKRSLGERYYMIGPPTFSSISSFRYKRVYHFFQEGVLNSKRMN